MHRHGLPRRPNVTVLVVVVVVVVVVSRAGFHVAEAKFQAQEAEYTELILAEDADKIMALLTNEVT
jgi:hypothetical protein